MTRTAAATIVLIAATSWLGLAWAGSGEPTQLMDECGPVRVGEAVPTFAGWDLAGRLVALKDLLPPRAEGKDVLVISFFATWCAPCREGLPSFAELARTDEATQVLLIAAGEDTARVAPYLRELGIDLVTVPDEFLKISGKFGLGGEASSLPRSFVVDREGKVRCIIGAEGADLLTVLKQEVQRARGEG